MIYYILFSKIHYMMNWFIPFGWFFMIIFRILIIAIIYYIITSIISKNSKDVQSEISALDILKERYAKGEIDDKEFEEKKKTLELK